MRMPGRAFPRVFSYHPTFNLMSPVTSLSVTSHPVAMLLPVMSNGTFCTTTMVRKNARECTSGHAQSHPIEGHSAYIQANYWLYLEVVLTFFLFFFFPFFTLSFGPCGKYGSRPSNVTTLGRYIHRRQLTRGILRSNRTSTARIRLCQYKDRRYV
jgi:hypothetical protein